MAGLTFTERLFAAPAPICNFCRRGLMSSAVRRLPETATKTKFADIVTNNRIPTSKLTRSAPSPRTVRASANAAAASGVREAFGQQRQQAQRERLDMEEGRATVADLERHLTRRWVDGDVYAPHDLSEVEQGKWRPKRKRVKPSVDAMDMLRMNPMDHYKNFSIMSEYMTPMGRIKHNSETGLRPVNQRKMAKAIRRAIGTGLLPGTYQHPEIIRQKLEGSGVRRFQ